MVILEKVAAINGQPKASPDGIAALINDLVNCGAVKAAQAEDTIRSLVAHPDNFVKLAATLATISMPAPSQGAGIAKSASITDTPAAPADAEWDEVIANGA